jgi:hypothetical protein
VDAGLPPHSPLASAPARQSSRCVPPGMTNTRIAVFPQLLE